MSSARSWGKIPYIVGGALCVVALVLFSGQSSEGSFRVQHNFGTDAGEHAAKPAAGLAAGSVTAPAVPAGPDFAVTTTKLASETRHLWKDAKCSDYITNNANAYTSQFAQDAFMWHNFFYKKTGPGFYLDVGAFDPVQFSNTYFYDKCLGWKGICFEGSAVNAAKFKGDARGCELVQKAVGNKAGKVSYINSGKHASLSTVSDTRDASLTGEGANAEAEVVTIQSVLDERGITHVDMMSLDIEGYELKALMGIDFTKTRIDYIVTENNWLTQEVQEYLQTKGYAKIWSMGADDFYVRLYDAPLWQPGNLHDMLSLQANWRKGQQAVRSYDDEALYQGWGKFLEANTHI